MLLQGMQGQPGGAGPDGGPPPPGLQPPNNVNPDESGVNAGLPPDASALGGPTSPGTINQDSLPVG
jgi:hypothetical protein